MDKATFWVLANLAVLRSYSRILRLGPLQSEQERPSLPLKGWVYLWTFTLPTETAEFLPLTMTWSRWYNSARRDLPYLRGVRVFEVSIADRWHVHFVSVERWSVQAIRSHALRYGFGRVNVRRIPAIKAAYVAKYITKMRARVDCKGGRLMSAFGFPNIVKASDIVTTSTWNDYVIKVTPQAPGQHTPWHMRVANAKKIWQESL